MTVVISGGQQARERLEVGICNPVYVPSLADFSILEAYCDDIASAGFNWIRTDIIWAHIQPTENTWNWTKYDQFVEIASSRKLNILFIISYSVGWANGNNSQMTPPIDNADYANFAAEVVRRYSPLGVKSYEIWNEPNLTGFWAPAPDAVAYANLLKDASIAMRAVDPNITIVMGSLAPVDTVNGVSVNSEVFLQTVYTTIGKTYFDVVGYHPYGWSLSKMNKLLHAMALNGDRNKDVWFTEYGNPTNGSNGQQFVSESSQSSLGLTALKNLKQYGWVSKLFFYCYKDIADRQPDREGYFGLKNADNSSKPIFEDIKNTLL